MYIIIEITFSIHGVLNLFPVLEGNQDIWRKRMVFGRVQFEALAIIIRLLYIAGIMP
jgi:intracellular septation protein A